MTPYATQQDLVARFGERELIQLTDRSGSGAIDSAVLDAAIADASEEIDTFVGARYSLPLATTPQIIVRWCADIARYRLFDNDVPEAVQKRYDAARSALRMLVEGKTTLGLDAGEAPQQAGAPSVTPGRRRISEADESDFRGGL